MKPVIEWKDNKVYMLDQRLLPNEEKIIEHKTYKEVADSIRNMVIRGAPAIGVAAAMGVALGMLEIPTGIESHFKKVTETLAETRPTAVNLFWAIKQMEQVFHQNRNDTSKLQRSLIREAIQMDKDDVTINKKMGENGQKLLKSGDTVMTHCNAGALATAGFGTALGVIRAAITHKKNIQVFANETRPFLQGARLTVWELQRDNIPVTLITDNMAGHIMSQGKINAVIVGADRIAANGDTANKIGTYSLAILAKHHHIPFYIAAPLSTIDISLKTGKQIPIEERDGNEVMYFMNQRTAREGTRVFNPAFDVTPCNLISAIVTEKKVIYPNFTEGIKELKT